VKNLAKPLKMPINQGVCGVGGGKRWESGVKNSGVITHYILFLLC
jgi:hypothetical protein